MLVVHVGTLQYVRKCRKCVFDKNKEKRRKCQMKRILIFFFSLLLSNLVLLDLKKNQEISKKRKKVPLARNSCSSW